MTRALQGICVLVTRPRSATKGLTELIEQHGGTPICQPGIALFGVDDAEPSLIELAQLEPADMVIFTSANAVQFALQRKPAAHWPAKTTLVAVGQRTAKALAEGGLDAVIAPPGGADSESVLQLPVLQQVAGRKILIACAPGGRQLLKQELTARGASVRPVFLYRTVPPKADDRILREIILAIDRLVITATSVRIVENITRILASIPSSSALNRPLCVISTRIAERAEQLGYQKIQVANGPGDQALLAAVLDVCRHPG